MKLGFLSAILPDLSFDKVLAFAAVNRFACVEVACWPVGKAERRFAGVTHLDVAKFTAARADDVHAMTLARGVTISALGYYPNPLDPDTAAAKRCVEHLKQVIRAARLLGLKTVNTFVGRDWTKSVDENWPRFLKTWKPLIALAEDHDVRIGIENCPMLFTRDEWPGGKNLATSPAIWRRMFSDIPSEHFGLNFDPSHFVLQHIEPASALREFREKLFHVHAKDARILRERLNEVGVFAFPKEWHQPRIPGFGDIDWARFIAALIDAGYDGPVVIEIEDDTFGHSLAGRRAGFENRTQHPRSLHHLTRLMRYSYEDMAGMIDHSLLHPTMTDDELRAGCELAAKYRVASVCIKPYAVKMAAELLRGSGVSVGAVIGFPHGSSTTEVKRFETATACRDGAREIDMVINIGKALSGDWEYVEADVRAVCEEARVHGAIVKVIFENDYLSGDEIKIQLCRVCERAGADFVKTSSGYGFVKGADGKYSYQGATEHDLKLMRANTSPKVQIKAAGGVRDLDALMHVRDLGVTRCGATATAAMLDEYRRRAAAGESPAKAGALGGGGY